MTFFLRPKGKAILSFAAGIVVCLGTVGCSSLGAPKSSIDLPFNDLLESRTILINRYSGMTNLYRIHATLMTTDVSDAQITVLGTDYEWTHDKIISERQQASQIASAQTTVFLDFYLPDASMDDLLAKNSIWRLFLDCEGKRYEGHVEKMKRPYAEILSIFPYHNKWATPYVVTFPVPLSNAERSRVVFTVTGPVGSEIMEYDHGKAIAVR